MGYTHGEMWTDELIEQKIKEVVEKLNLDHFPTHTEIVQVFGNKGLASKISKHKGTVYWAEKIGINAHCLLHRKDMGWTIEEILTTPLRGKRNVKC